MRSLNPLLTHKRPFPLSTSHQCHCTDSARLPVYPRCRPGATRNADGCGRIYSRTDDISWRQTSLNLTGGLLQMNLSAALQIFPSHVRCNAGRKETKQLRVRHAGGVSRDLFRLSGKLFGNNSSNKWLSLGITTPFGGVIHGSNPCGVASSEIPRAGFANPPN